MVLKFLFSTFLCGLGCSVGAQIETHMIEAPSAFFKSIEVNSYKGIPILGNKSKDLGQHQLTLLWQMGYMQAYYDSMQTKYPTAGTHIKYKVEKNNQASVIAQKHLMEVVSALISQRGVSTYFSGNSSNGLKKNILYWCNGVNQFLMKLI